MYNLIQLTRKELKNMNASEFKDNDVIKCGKYYIHIVYGGYTYPIKSYVNTEESMCDLPIRKFPQFISDFLL